MVADWIVIYAVLFVLAAAVVGRVPADTWDCSARFQAGLPPSSSGGIGQVQRRRAAMSSRVQDQGSKAVHHQAL